MSCKKGTVIYFIVQLIAFILILVGTPIDMYREKTQSTLGNTGCITLWGYKMKCYDNKYALRMNEMYKACPKWLDRFKAAEAFAIISIIVYGVACVFGFVQLCCCQCLRWVCLVLNIVGVITAAIVWGCVADMYNNDLGCYKAKGYYKYGAGFALVVTAWCLCIVAIIFLLLPF